MNYSIILRVWNVVYVVSYERVCLFFGSSVWGFLGIGRFFLFFLWDKKIY